MPITIEPATERDLPAIERLLTSHHLPLDGVRECVATALIARLDDEAIGCAALEVYPSGVLLRSVAVAGGWRGHGVGSQLTDAALAMARHRRAPAAFLLTTTARDFFSRLGFRAIDRAEVPGDVKASIEFRSACPASAVAMSLSLG